jgi:hypothetical protein
MPMISILLLCSVAIVLAFAFFSARALRRRQTSLERENVALTRELERHRDTAQSILRELAVVVPFVLILISGCAGEPRPISVTCKPAPKVIALQTKKPKAAAGEVVHVYWDVSKTMSEFTLKPVVEALDSGVLLSAHATAVQQYGVGTSITDLPSARAALRPTANSTVLHLAAEQIGTALATGAAHAAIVVSDMRLDTPPRTSAANATVCGGVPLPSTPEAGYLFGRCFEKAFATSRTPNLLVHVFRQTTKDRELFILLLATHRGFGQRISDQIAKRLEFEREVIFDSAAATAAKVSQCKLTTTPDVRLGQGACVVKCFEPEAVVDVQCDVVRPKLKPWIVPVARGENGTTFDAERARFSIPCTTTPGAFDGHVSFTWRNTSHELGARASVRDLFASLSDALVRSAAKYDLQIAMKIEK